LETIWLISNYLDVIFKNCSFDFSNNSYYIVPDQGNSYDINRKAVEAMTELGKGHEAV
jgi:hypothetical protein